MKRKETILKSKTRQKRPAKKASGPSRRAGGKGQDGAGVAQPDRLLIVGLGASAGGLQAFKTFFTHMPADSGMAFVLIQHLDPHHHSMLADILSLATKMSVSEVVDPTSPAANHVYVIPPNATLTVAGGKLRVSTPAPARGSRWPIDTFFSSLAEDQGERSICVILSGGGSDGTKGLKAIKEHGGLTIAQAVSGTSAQTGMPSSAVASGFVDEVLAVEDIPARLIAYQDHLGRVSLHKDPDGVRVDAATFLPTICTLLRAATGHDFGQYKEKTLIRRIQRRMQILHIESAPAYIEKLRAEPLEVDLLFHEFLVGVTDFFRDPQAFDALEKQVIPQLIQGKGTNDTVRVWVPACATGQEVYSLAILLKEAADKLNVAPRIQIFATDIDELAVKVARTARYHRAQMEGIRADRLARWFVADGDRFTPLKEIRAMCVFSEHTVIKDPPFSRLDLISCRNLMIYLGAELQDRTIRTFHYALRPRGYLFLGASESVTRHPALFAAVNGKYRIFERVDAPAFMPIRPAGADSPAAKDGAEVSEWSAEKGIERSARQLIEKYVPAYVVVNRRHDVLRFSGRMDRYLGPASGTATLNLFSLLREGLRTAARLALKQVRTVQRLVIHEGLPITIDGRQQFVDLRVEPLPDSEDAFCVVAFFDRKTEPDTVSKTDATSARSVKVLESELKETRDQLGLAIDQLETSNEELISANEEFHSVNEELQSTNEELETSKEEMQSINEELQTVNTELTSKNDALMNLNSDLQNLMDSTLIATLFLDRGLRIRNFTPAVSDIFHVRDTDRGRPVTEIVSRISYEDLKKDANRVMRDLGVIERRVWMEEDGLWYLMRLRPYRTLANLIDGVVVTFTDITDYMRNEEERTRLVAMVDSSEDAIIGVNPQNMIISWNRGAERLFDYSAADIVGKPITVLDPPDRRNEEPELLERLWTGDHIANYDTVRMGKDGRLVNVSISLSPVRSVTGDILGTSRIIHDATLRKQSEAALIKSEERYRTLFAEIGEGFCIIEKADVHVETPSDFRILVANPSFAKQSGIDNVVGMTIREVFSWEPHKLVDTFNYVLTTGEAVRFEHRLPTHGRVLGLYVFRLNDSTQRRVAILFSDITERKQTDNRQKLLMDELNHRVKNTLATVQSIAAKSLKEPDPKSLQMFTARLTALSRTHNLLARDNWEAVSLRDLLLQELEPYRSQHGTSFTIEGPAISVNSKAALSLGLAIHELTTNAAKHGALSTAAGIVRVKWSIREIAGLATLEFEWSESGGPLVGKTEHKGFGSVVLQRSLAFDLDADVRMNFATTGLVCTLAVPLSEVDARSAETADASQ